MKLKPPSGARVAWRAVYVDPDTDRTVYESLDPTGVGRTAETRRAWAIQKSQTLTRRRAALELGAPKAQGATVGAAVERYFEDHPEGPGRRASTLALYRLHADAFLTWTDRSGVSKADDLTQAHLTAYRASCMKVKRRVPVADGEQGAKRFGTTPRAASSVNVELRAVRAILSYLRSLGLLARLTSDNLRDGLKHYSVTSEKPTFLRPPEIKALLAAAMDRDAKARARVQPIAPMIAAALLSGMRAGELVSLTWDRVDFDAAPAGEIQITAGGSKTDSERFVTLEVSPALRSLLLALRPADARGSVFGHHSASAKSALRRLELSDWQKLRRTCATYLWNTPNIAGARTESQKAEQLGHGEGVAKDHYNGRMRGIPPEATTLEAAMGCEAEITAIVDAARAR